MKQLDGGMFAWQMFWKKLTNTATTSKSSNNGKALIYNLISYFTARCRINYNDYTVFLSDP
jgi:hypothetical protein